MVVISIRCLTEKLLLPLLREDAALAIEFLSKYLSLMSFNVVRRLFAILLTLSLTLGPAGSGVHASSMGATMAVVSLSDAHGQGDCNDCPGSKSGVPPRPCSVCCTGVCAVSPVLAALPLL